MHLIISLIKDDTGIANLYIKVLFNKSIGQQIYLFRPEANSLGNVFWGVK